MKLNIVVNSEYRAVITDFGSARFVRKRPDRPTDSGEPASEQQPQGLVLDVTVCESTNTITLTRSSFTLRWAAPEVLNDGYGGTEGDIWSFGWICYEVCTSHFRRFLTAAELTEVREGHDW